MKNFGTLFGYEMKKIWKRPMTWAVVLIFSAVFVYSMARPFLPNLGGANFTYTDAEGREISKFLTGDEQYRIQIEGSRSLSGLLMDEDFFRAAREGVPKVNEMFGRDNFFYLVDPTYIDVYWWYGERIDGTAEDFYTNRMNGIEWGWEHAGLSEDEIAYWQAMEAQVEKPFVYYPVYSFQNLLNSLGGSGGGVTSFLPLIAGACLCELFSQERRARVDALIFSSRRGRLTQYLAKMLAGGVSAMLAAALVAGATVAASLALHGISGAEAQIQLLGWLWTSSLPVTVGQAVLILLALMLVYALLCGAAAALVSVLTGSGVAALAVSVGIMLAAMLHYEEEWAAYLPNNLVDEQALLSLRLTDLFGLRLNFIQSGFLLYLLIAVILFGLCWLGWRRNATCGK